MQLLFLILPFLLLLGCAAPHDNPLDPKSAHYVAPEPPPPTSGLSAQVWSEHVSRIFPVTDLYQVHAELESADTALVVDSVWATYDGRNPVAMRTDEDSPHTWETTFSASYLSNDPHMAPVLGMPFTFDVRDVRDSLYQLGPLYVFRIIETVPQTTSPDSDVVIGPHATLEWPTFNATYPYGVQPKLDWYYPVIDSASHDTLVIRDSTIWTSPLLPSAQLLVYVPDSLFDGRYYWTLTVLDSFGNSSRSKEARFTVAFGARP